MVVVINKNNEGYSGTGKMDLCLRGSASLSEAPPLILKLTRVYNSSPFVLEDTE